jgi:1-phosphofructokinase family hexose kinase
MTQQQNSAQTPRPATTMQNPGQPVLTVTVNPALDLFLSVKELTPGALHRVAPPQQHPGGKGINVAKALHAFGVPTVATGFLGGSRGSWIERELVEAGVAAKFVRIQDQTRVNVKVTDAAGTLTEFNSPAPDLTAEDWLALERHLDTLAQTGGWLAFCGNLPASCATDWYRRRIEWAKRRGLRTVLDASGEALREGVLAKPDVIKPNLRELEELVGRQVKSIKEVVAAAARLCQSGVGLVAVSLGGDGLVAATREGCVWAHVPKVPVVSSVGAGDTVVAGILYGIHQDFSFSETIRFAAAAGTAAVTTGGTTWPELRDVEELLSHIDIEPVEV